jgi:hypothetical protein
MSGNIQRKLVVYLETSFVSHWAGQDLQDPLQLAKHEMSVAWWRNMEGRMTPVVSEVVLTEISDGPADGAARRIGMVSGLPVWGTIAEARALAKELLLNGGVKMSKPDDALHIAVAAAGGADVVVSWNFKDIVNERKLPLIKSVVEQSGCRCPLLVSPDKTLEDLP